MNVLLIHQLFTSGQEAGGTRHYELGQRLVAEGDRLTIVASQISYLTGRPVDASRKGLYYRESIGGIEVLRAYVPPVYHRSFLLRVATFAAFALTSVWAGLRAEPVDLVMGTSPPIFQAFSAWLVACLRRRRFLLEVRDLWPKFAIDMGVLRNPVLKAVARRAERFLYRRADHLLVNSPAYRDHLIQQGVPADKVSLVPNGVDVEMFDPDARGEAIRQRYGVADKLLVVYAGALGMANDLGTVLQAADRLRDQGNVHFLLVGDGKERANLEQEARHRGLTNVTFTGPLPKSRMPEVLAAADLCLATLMNIPAFTTTYPNKVFDYMASGRPTILAIGGVIRDVIETAKAGVYVPPGDAIALAAAIGQLAGDAELRACMGRSARRHVAEHFNRREQADEFRRVLRSLLAHEVLHSCPAPSNG